MTDRLELALVRGLLMADATCPLERAAALYLRRQRLDHRIDRELRFAHSDGASYAEIARRLNLSRQATRQRLRRGSD